MMWRGGPGGGGGENLGGGVSPPPPPRGAPAPTPPHARERGPTRRPPSPPSERVRAPDVDAVCIGTWPYVDCAITLVALDAGKHVLCEARMAMDAAEARRMLDGARRSPHLITQLVPAPNTLEVDATSPKATSARCSRSRSGRSRGASSTRTRRCTGARTPRSAASTS